MKFHYYPETTLFILSYRAGGQGSIEVAPGVVLDFDGEGHPVASIWIMPAST